MEEKVYKDIEKALIKKAVGYDAEEVVEEFADDEGDLRLLKRKVTTKNFPPDVSAAKLLLDIGGSKSVEEMTDEELEEQKNRLLKLLEEIESNANKKDKP
ncbi:MAG: hypothetical protein IJ706_01890 [Clostridia bacterium]|nr:hypothetical protein [Clostridia bacterium]MBR1676045.1 hypothetical protein [Clostridia bacterium]